MYDPSEDNLFTAARRVLRSIRSDDASGGLLSLDTIKANEHLALWIENEERKIKERRNDDGK